MATTTLRAYLDDLNLLLEHEALEEVIGHCRHILQHFPKNVEAYRFLGRALLEKGRAQEAADVFQRVLSAIPDDFTAHLGLSSAAEQQGQIDTAIWHLERAYEQQPNNATLQTELKRLYERRGSAVPQRIQLTRGALARLYLKGKLYSQANAELQKALEQTPDRIDLPVLQVEALRQNDNLLEAGEVALHVLEKLPDSLEANCVLASIWLKSSRPSDAAPFINRLEGLDPFLAWQIVNPEIQLPRDAFQLPRLNWNAKAAAALATDVPDWVNTIGDVFDSPDSVPLSNKSGDWSRDTLSTSTPAPSSPSYMLKKTGNLKLPAEKDENAVPDWFKTSAPTPASTAAVPDWLDDALASPATTTDQSVLPSWMDDEQESALRTDQPSGFTDLLMNVDAANSTSSQSATPSAPTEGVPDWLADIPAETATSEPAALDALSWLNTGSLPSTEGQQAAEVTDNESEPAAMDALSWLNTGSLPQEPATAQPTSESSLNWTDDEPDNFAALFDPDLGETAPVNDLAMTDQAFSTVPKSAEPAAEADDDPLAWMRKAGLTPLEPEESTSAMAANLMLDWSTEESAPAAEPVDDDPLAWMRKAGLTPLEPAEPVETSLDWLGEPATPEVAAEPTAEADEDPLAWMRKAGLTPIEPMEPPIESAESALPWEIDSAPTASEPIATDAAHSWLNEPAEPISEPVESVSFDEKAEPDWLSGMAAIENVPVEETVEPAAPTPELNLDWLSGVSSTEPVTDTNLESLRLDWLNEPANAQPTITNQAQPEAEEDPITWMQQHGVVPLSATGQLRASSSSVDSELDLNKLLSDEHEQDSRSTPQPVIPDWLNAMVPPAKAPIKADELDFSSLTPTDKTPDISALGDLSTVEAAQDDWLSQLSQPTTKAPSDSGALDWLAQSTQSAPENDWLGSFETSERNPPVPIKTEDVQPNHDNWLFSTAASESLQNVQSEKDNWLGSSTDSQAEPSQPAADDWLASLQINPTAPTNNPAQPAVAAESNEEWLTPDSKDQFDKLLKLASDKANEPRVIADTGILDDATMPDWLAGLSPEPVEMPRPVTDVDASQTPDWLAELGTESTEPPISAVANLDWSQSTGTADLTPEAPAQSSEPDWLREENKPVETSAVPDWLASMAPPQKTVPATPTRSLDELDFGSLQPTENRTSEPVLDLKSAPDKAKPVGELAVDRLESITKDAQPDQAPGETVEKSAANITTTGAQTESKASFTFDRTPAWKRKKATQPESQPSPTQPEAIKDTLADVPLTREPAWKHKKAEQPEPQQSPTQPPKDDLADLLQDLAGSAGEESDLPDWLKD